MFTFNIKKSVQAMTFLLLATSTTHVLAQDIVESPAEVQAAHERCNAMTYPFVLNKANVNALVALACTTSAQVNNQQVDMSYDNSTTMFHQWTTTDDGQGIHVEGTCAVNLDELRANSFSAHKINITFTKSIDSLNRPSIHTSGIIAGRSLDLSFGTQSFLDSHCFSGEVSNRRLKFISMGLTPGLNPADILDMLRSHQLGASLTLGDNETWVQGNVSNYFSGLGLMYTVNQSNRQLGLAMVPQGSNMLAVRMENILEHYEMGSFFEVEKDSMGMTTGFKDTSVPINGLFQAYSVDGGGSQVQGCTSLVFDGELGRPLVNVDMNQCQNLIHKSGLSKFTLKERQDDEQVKLRAEEKVAIANTVASRKVQDYLDAQGAAPVKRYCAPGVAATGCARWLSADRSRGYVVTQRDISIDTAKQQVNVSEFRMDLNGHIGQKKYVIKLSDLR